MFGVQLQHHLGMVHVFSEFRKNPRWPTHGTFCAENHPFWTHDIVCRIAEVKPCTWATNYEWKPSEQWLWVMHVYSEFWKNPRWPPGEVPNSDERLKPYLSNRSLDPFDIWNIYRACGVAVRRLFGILQKSKMADSRHFFIENHCLGVYDFVCRIAQAKPCKGARYCEWKSSEQWSGVMHVCLKFWKNPRWPPGEVVNLDIRLKPYLSNRTSDPFDFLYIYWASGGAAIRLFGILKKSKMADLRHFLLKITIFGHMTLCVASPRSNRAQEPYIVNGNHQSNDWGWCTYIQNFEKI